MKVLFLDIDGVLNWDGTTERCGRYLGIDPAMVARFNRIIDAHPDVKIVISSTWRRCDMPLDAYKNFDELIAYLKSQGLRGDIIGKTPFKMGYIARGEEIKMWFRGEGKALGVEQYVILDDDTSGMAPYVKPEFDGRWMTEEEFAEDLAKWKEEGIDLRKHHVITSDAGYPPKEATELWTEGGLQDEHVELAIKILNGHEIP